MLYDIARTLRYTQLFPQFLLYNPKFIQTTTQTDN